MTTDETNNLIQQAKAGNQSARDRLIIHHLGMIRRISHSMQQRCVDRIEADELITSGVFALIQCINTFDTSKGILFRTYAGHRIRGEMLDYIRTMDLVPRIVRARTRRLTAASESFIAQHGRAPDQEELQKESKLDDRTFGLHARETMRETRSLDSIVIEKEGGRHTYARDGLADPSTEQAIDAVDAHDLMRHVLDRHGLRAALLLKLRFLDGWTISKIGTAFLPTKHRRPRNRGEGISDSAISVSLKDLIRDIRESLGVQPCQ